MDLDEVTEENGYPPIAMFYMESQQWLDQYYELPETLRDDYLDEHTWVFTLLYFWGRWKANMSDSVRIAVEKEARKYDIPLKAIPAFRG